MDNQPFALKDLFTIFPATAVKKAEKFALREVEETDKGHWVAFADDGPESYDVQVRLEKGLVTQHSCDCGKLDVQGFCLHQLAMLLQLSTSKTKVAKSVTKRKVKEDPMTVLLNQLDPEELKVWLREVLNQQKDLAIAFTNRFAAKPADYTNEEIVKITDSAVRSVVKNKKKLDQSELKKIILLWKEVHGPIINYYLSHITSVEKIETFLALLLSIDRWHRTFNINSTKIDTYKKEVFAKTIQPLYDIENESIWRLVIEGYFRQGFVGENPTKGEWLIFLSDLVKFETRETRVDFILDNFKKNYTALSQKKGSYVSEFFTQLVYKTYKDADKISECVLWIQPITYENSFNLELIDNMILFGFEKEGEALCRSIMKNNSVKGYNIPYLLRLAKLYKKSPAQRAKLYPVLLEMFPYAGDVEDYQIMKEEYFKTKPEEFKKWYTRIITYLGHNVRSSTHDANLYFDILHHEGKVTKMLDKIRDSITIGVALKYFNVLFAQNKMIFLENLASIGGGFYLNETDAKYYPEVAEKIQQHYTDTEIKNRFLISNRFSRTPFVRYFESIYLK